MKITLAPKFKLWISTECGEGVFGDGKFHLLQAVEEHGSLRSAAATLGISYRKAWGDLKNAERILGVPLIEKRRGGLSGGGASLTEAGRRWMKSYERFRNNLEDKAGEDFQIMIREVFRPGDSENGETDRQ